MREAMIRRADIEENVRLLRKLARHAQDAVDRVAAERIADLFEAQLLKG